MLKRTPHRRPVITTRLSRHRVLVGGSVRDFAGLHRVTKLAAGAVRYRVYSTLRGCRADTFGWPGKLRHGLAAGIVQVRGAVVPGSLRVTFPGRRLLLGRLLLRRRQERARGEPVPDRGAAGQADADVGHDLVVQPRHLGRLTGP